jgi:hypothetical protein
MDKVVAPFTKDQVESLNQYQASGYLHPFTCGRPGRLNHGDYQGRLVATKDGWHCEGCDYTQDWAHSWMADWGWMGAGQPLHWRA